MSTPAKGLTFAQALGVAFIVLKLTGHIQWSWAWVLTPVWLSLIVSIMIDLAEE